MRKKRKVVMKIRLNEKRCVCDLVTQSSKIEIKKMKNRETIFTVFAYYNDK